MIYIESVSKNCNYWIYKIRLKQRKNLSLASQFNKTLNRKLLLKDLTTKN